MPELNERFTLDSESGLVLSSRNFSYEELGCRGMQCGAVHEQGMDLKFMQKLQELRDVARRPLIVNSGYRCPAYNTLVSGTGMNGPHTTRKAVDIKIAGAEAHRILRLALIIGFSGIGVKQKGPYDERFLHLDEVIEGTRPWIWSY